MCFPQTLQHFPTGQARHQQVQHNGVVFPCCGFVQPLGTVTRFVHRIPVFAQCLSDCAEQIRFIFDDKNSHGRPLEAVKKVGQAPSDFDKFVCFLVFRLGASPIF